MNLYVAMSYWKCLYYCFLFVPLWLHASVLSAELVVAQDGSGDYSTIQEAIMAVPDMRSARTVIRIKPGVYKEKLVLPASKTNVSLIGEDADVTILTYDDYSSKKNRFGEAIGTSGSSSFFVFGDGFYAENVTFENSAGPVGQAVAVRVSADRVFFNRCRFLGHQDTLYPQLAGSRQYYKDCYIEGTTDFIFGAATALFQSCEIHCKLGGSYITAASTPDTVQYGFVFQNCIIGGEASPQSTYLGRPWRPYAKTVFINCHMGEQIRPEGWHNWEKESNERTVSYAEYNNRGEGVHWEKRVSWADGLTAAQAEYYTKERILNGWNPESGDGHRTD
ncbi:pectinesterase family protein [Parapedobacter deserti]|uniref:Pectinesterase n=1 Tax=Parapedobacter deserti TaxID=1912957 RepID=A0ABV7JL10_9SPHI